MIRAVPGPHVREGQRIQSKVVSSVYSERIDVFVLETAEYGAAVTDPTQEI